MLIAKLAVANAIGLACVWLSDKKAERKRMTRWQYLMAFFLATGLDAVVVYFFP